MTTRRIKLSDAIKKKGKSREKLLENMTEEEIKRRAEADPDNPILTEEQMNEFKIATKRKQYNEKDD